MRWGIGFHSSGEEAMSPLIGMSFSMFVPLSREKRDKLFMSWVGGS